MRLFNFCVVLLDKVLWGMELPLFFSNQSIPIGVDATP